MTTEASSIDLSPRGARTSDLLGHPTGLSILFGTEMWERFNYYGMRALLILYMIKYLFVPGHVEAVLGYGVVKSVLESIFGPLGIQPIASQIYGFYTSLNYLTAIFGGYIADRYLGQRLSVYIGGSLMAAGEFMLMSDALFFPGLLALVIGSGAFKPNLCSQVGNLYVPGDSRRDRAYSVYYVGVNLGAFIAPLIAGTLGEKLNWHYGFAAAGVGMLLGLVIYRLGDRHLPPDLRSARQRPEASGARQSWTREERRIVGALLILVLLNAVFWACFEQQGNTIPLWADDYTDRTIGAIGFEIPVTWFQSLNPILIFLLTPAVIWLWNRQAAAGSEPSTLVKMAIGCGFCGLSYVLLAAVAALSGPDKASWLWMVPHFVLLTLGELYLSPIGLSLVSRVSPPRMVSALMGMWYLGNFGGNFMTGYLGSFWSSMDKSSFFIMIAAISFAAAAGIAAFIRPLKPILG